MKKANNIQIVSDNYMCSSCGACDVACPKDAIRFNYSNIGRLTTTVTDTCVNCGLCLKVCPSLNITSLLKEVQDEYVGVIEDVFIGKSSNPIIYGNAQSGGACTGLTTYLLQNKIVDAILMCKICSGDAPFPQAVLVRDPEEIIQCQKSSYTPVNLLSALKSLRPNEKIAIVGIPCQIEGITLLVEKSMLNVTISYKLGLICDRVHCRGYLDSIISYTHGKELFISWRKKDFKYNDKHYIYKNAPIVITNDKKEEFIFSNKFRFALKDLFTAPRCRICVDKLNINADIVFGDPWKMSGVDWVHGESLVIARTNFGKKLIQRVCEEKKIELRKANLEEMLDGQSIKSRRIMTSAYVKALNKYVPSFGCYLLERDVSNVSNSDYSRAQKDIDTFMIWESKGEDEIRREAHLRIAKETGIWHNDILFLRVKMKLASIYYNCIRKVFNR